MPDLNYKESNRRIVFGILDHLWRHPEEMHPLENGSFAWIQILSDQKASQQIATGNVVAYPYRSLDVNNPTGNINFAL